MIETNYWMQLQFGCLGVFLVSALVFVLGSLVERVNVPAWLMKILMPIALVSFVVMVVIKPSGSSSTKPSVYSVEIKGHIKGDD